MPRFNISFFYAFNCLDKSEKGLFPAHPSKNILKKVVETLAGLKERRTFAPAIERTTMVAKAIFEDIYIIRQVVQESESSISMRVPSI